MPYGLKDEQLNEINACFIANAHIKKAILFGSRAKGNFKPGSDIDIALAGDAVTMDDVLHIYNQLDDSWLPYTFDLVILNSHLDADLKDHINRVGITIYEREKQE